MGNGHARRALVEGPTIAVRALDDILQRRCIKTKSNPCSDHLTSPGTSVQRERIRELTSISPGEARDQPRRSGWKSCFVRLLRHDAFHDLLPGSRPEFRVSPVQIHPRQGQVHVRLTLRFIPRLEQPLRLVFVVSLETRLRAGKIVLEVENAPGPTHQTILLLHRFSHGCECEAAGPFAVSEQWASIIRAETEFCAGCETARPRPNPCKKRQFGWRRGSESTVSRHPKATGNQRSIASLTC